MKRITQTRSFQKTWDAFEAWLTATVSKSATRLKIQTA
jgi:hypothetical protein